MKISDKVKLYLLKNNLSDFNKKIFLIKIIKKMILLKKKDKLSYYYCFNKHIEYLYNNKLLSYVYFTFIYKLHDKPNYLQSNNVQYTENDIIFVNNLFNDEYKIETIIQENKKENYLQNNCDFKSPIDFLHPIYGKIYITSYKRSIEIHLFYIYKNDIELSKKWLDIAMTMTDKPKYIKYEYLLLN